MTLISILIVILAIVTGTSAITILGTIYLANRLGNYERALPICFSIGLAAVVAILSFQPSFAAVLLAAYWILGVSAALILGWLVLIFSRR